MKPFHATDFDEPSHVRSTDRNAEIAEVLARSHSRKEAATRLGIPATTLERMCRVPELESLYDALAARGTSRRGPPVEKPLRLKRWSFFWRVSPGVTVCIWPGRELDAVTAEEAIDVFMTKVARCMAKADITAVEVTPTSLPVVVFSLRDGKETTK